MHGQTPPRGGRAQTSIDFVVGMSVFLLTVAFVVGFVPGVFEPFTASGEEATLTADRTAAALAEHLLADPATPSALNATCTAEFFSTADGGLIEACRFDADASDLETALGVGSTTGVNVTVEEDGSYLRAYENGTVSPDGDVSLRAGPDPPDSGNVVTARRVVLLDGEGRNLYVRVW